MSTILLVEDNPHIMKINAQLLTLRGYQVLQAETAAQAREQLRWHPVDLIVLDILLPDGSGLELCRELKAQRPIPILFLTALGENQDVVEGLRAGGDDYLAKPYDLEVLVARIEARLRAAGEVRRYFGYGGLKLDLLTMTGYVNGKDIQLTQKEFTALLLLARAAERKVSQEELMEALWGPDAHAESRALWTLISRLRKKLNSQESRLEISSLRGGGYLLEQL
ncbi:response regulator transcription factor [Allofournierella massiliensis]|uniref:Stage 0 sporulation protein A homolog n=1 Tax=Allofournierella massiliensis TaxID=1650663 RepID=A0ABT7UPC0_9FIRM|nr:response regulator transcription factor [Fournierella massiliensis]MDM8200736.1 response regulator transcription factor [Fournierella massiliensis]